MLPIGTPAPGFSLPDVVTGQTVSMDDFAGKNALLVMFICAHCPFVIHLREELARLGRDYAGMDAAFVAISSNDTVKYPEDSPEKLAAMARQLDFTFPVLFDETQSVARAYSAACTPDFFLFDKERKLVYRGQLDDSRPGKGVADGHDLRAALDAVLAGREVPLEQKPSVGCNIKWR
jgi:peroxiredoxin